MGFQIQMAMENRGAFTEEHGINYNKHFTSLINVIPFIMIILSCAMAYISSTGFYHSAFKYLPDSIGYSVITNLVFLKHFQRKAYCNPTKACVYGLLLMNIVSLLVKSKLIIGSNWYDISITFIVLGIILIGYIKRW